MALDHIEIRGACEHNLKNLDVAIPRRALIVVTGLSGSGKSSLAFDTVYVEGQRRYVESLSAYARQFLQMTRKPKVEHIAGLPPTIAIEQRRGQANPRSTVATATEIYDYLRLLYARAGQPHCWKCGKPIARLTPQQIVDQVLSDGAGQRLMLLAPMVRGRKGNHRDILDGLRRDGYVRARIDGDMVDLHDVKECPDKRRKHMIDAVVDRVVPKPEDKGRLAESVEAALRLGKGIAIAAVEEGGKWRDILYSENFGCPDCDVSFPELEPRMFSFNAPYGACPECAGLGTRLSLDPDLIVPDPSRSLDEGAVEIARKGGMILAMMYKSEIRDFARRYKASLTLPYERIPKKLRDILLFGDPDSRLFDDEDALAAASARHGSGFAGLIPMLERQFRKTQSETIKHKIHEYMAERGCVVCGGKRLKPEVLAVTVGGLGIHELCALAVRDALAFANKLELPGEASKIADPILREVRQRLAFMSDVGLDYLGLDRATGSLSGGEHQRIRLASQVGSGLVGVCYVLDEPTIGLHQRDNDRLLATLVKLRDLGNTVLVVEHDADVIRAADHLIDLGPGAGEEGGRIVAQGTVAEVAANPESPTGRYLAGVEFIAVPPNRRPAVPAKALKLEGARGNNLQSLDVVFPLGTFTCVTGMSGSGKSTLVSETLAKALARGLHGAREKPAPFKRLHGLSLVDKLVVIDQSPIGKTPRSNPATYTGAFDEVRRLFASTPEAKARGYSPGRFSFNVKGGRCEHCEGAGIKKIEMHFLPDVFVECEQCEGKRYNRETLQIRYKGRNIQEVLDMPIAGAAEFFANFPALRPPLSTLEDVGLGYVRLGQSSTTLSGGEAQRVKLAYELASRATGRTVYILDEPTTGLHFADIRRLLSVLNRLVDLGNTVIVIEHNLDVVKSADWIIDLGPEGGDRGGRLLAAGTPEHVARAGESRTGQYLRHVLAQAAGGPSGSVNH